jgi:glycosyltransferase involved in cell wall biosynthesis
MKILFIGAYYKPEIAASLYLKENVIEKLAEKGEEIELIVPNPVRGVNRETIKKFKNDKSLCEQEEYGGALKIHRVYVPFTEKGGLLKRAVRYYFMYRRLYKRAKKIKSDVIWVSSTPPVIFLNMAGKIARKTGAEVVYNVQDIFPESAVSMKKIKKSGLIEKFLQKFDKRSYKYADSIITISEEFKKILTDIKMVPEQKISVVYNWVEESKVVPICKEKNSLFDEYNLDRNKFYITYSGNIGLSQSLETLIQVALRLKENTDIMFVIIGSGANKENLEKSVKSLNLSNIRFIPFQPYEKIAEVFSLGDAGLVISKKGTGKSSLPSKTWSIMSAGKPVIASFDDGELTSIIRQNACGICIEPDNVDELYRAVLRLYENRELAAEMGKNGREFVLNNLSKEIATNKIYKIIKSLSRKSEESISD